jgi:hypothetical protein
VGLLDSFERGLERAVNGAFAKTFRSGIQPVELAAALRGELDTKAAVVSRERIIVPHTLTVRLAPNDYDRMAALGPTLTDELTGIVQKHARTQGYSFAGPLSIELVRDGSLSTGTLRAESRAAEGRVSWQGVLDIAGRRYPLTKSRTVIGRGSDADITVADSGTSRQHVEVLWDGEHAMVRDLKSTNGTKLAGRPVTQASLTPDSTITIGRTDIVFRIVASAAPAPRIPADDATRAFSYRDGGPLA